MKVLVAGDYCPTGRITDLIETSNYMQIFEEVVPYINKADYSVVNFESTIAKVGYPPIKKLGPNLCCTPSSISAIKEVGFNCVTLANNHFRDFSQMGVRDTIDCLELNEIDYVGGGRNIDEARRILYKKIGNNTLAIINCCENEFSIISNQNGGGSNPLNPVSQYYDICDARNNADFVLVIVHGGHEHYQLPSPRMVELYRYFVDIGADAVVNHHQHCFSGFEYYKNKPIFYGLGNFCFDFSGQKRPWHEGFFVEIDFDIKVTSCITPYCQFDVEPKIRILNKEEKIRFDQTIEELNSCILNPVLLNEKFIEFCKTQKNSINIILSPYKNKYLQELFIRGFLPDFFDKQDKISLLDYIKCEAHRDVLLENLDHYVI